MEEKLVTNYYALLEVSNTATQADIEAAWKRLKILHHPDRNRGNEEAATIKFQSIQRAYLVLSDPNDRAHYDKYGHEQGQEPYVEPSSEEELGQFLKKRGRGYRKDLAEEFITPELVKNFWRLLAHTRRHKCSEQVAVTQYLMPGEFYYRRYSLSHDFFELLKFTDLFEHYYFPNSDSRYKTPFLSQFYIYNQKHKYAESAYHQFMKAYSRYQKEGFKITAYERLLFHFNKIHFNSYLHESMHSEEWRFSRKLIEKQKMEFEDKLYNRKMTKKREKEYKKIDDEIKEINIKIEKTQTKINAAEKQREALGLVEVAHDEAKQTDLVSKLQIVMMKENLESYRTTELTLKQYKFQHAYIMSLFESKSQLKVFDTIYTHYLVPLQTKRDELPEGHPKRVQFDIAINELKTSLKETVVALVNENKQKILNHGQLNYKDLKDSRKKDLSSANVKLCQVVIDHGTRLSTQREIRQDRNRIAAEIKLYLGAFIAAIGIVCVLPIPLLWTQWGRYSQTFFMPESEAVVQRATDKMKHTVKSL